MTKQGQTVRPHAELPQDELQRVARQLNLPGFSMDHQRCLYNSHVLIIGAGGLGCPALQQLAAAGVGEITLIDADSVDITNIHRQILFGAGDIGQPKVAVAARRAKDLQPGITIHELQQRLTPDNALELFRTVDLVVDGSDTFATKYLAADAAEITGTPLVWGTVLRYEGQAALWHSGPGAPHDRGVGLRDFFPEQPSSDFAPDCATAGVFGVTTSIIAGLMVTRALAHLSGCETPVGQVSSYRALAATLRNLSVGADPERQLITGLHSVYAEPPCAASIDNAAVINLLASDQVAALDVREPHEVAIKQWPRAQPTLFPLSELRGNDHTAPLPEALPDETAEKLFNAPQMVVACASGVRSQQFIVAYGLQAARHGTELINLPGGINALPADSDFPSTSQER